MTNEEFSNKFVTEDQVREEIMNRDGSKANPIGDMSVDILKSIYQSKKAVFLKSLSLLKLAQSSKIKMT